MRLLKRNGRALSLVKRIAKRVISWDERTRNLSLVNNWNNHLDLLAVKQYYYNEDQQESVPLKINDGDPKAVAFYLPQFHPIPENDKAWGKGFTEWTNVASGQPRFVGHNQPLYPADLGYYDLRVDEIMKQQIDLAVQHNIYGFCFYYYWFSGHRPLEMPIKKFLDHQEWDFNFMICWANESWTKRWDGQDDKPIIAQKYSKTTPLDFIKDVEPILTDERYIRVQGRPVLAVYRIEMLGDDPKEYTHIWRDYFKKRHNLELHLVSVLSHADTDPTLFGFDAAIEFVPGGMGRRESFFQKYAVNQADRLLDPNFTDEPNDYRKIVLGGEFFDTKYGFPTYKCVMPSWDNDSRKKGKGSTIFFNDSPDLYALWLKDALSHRKPETPLTFINAWNEWGEGTVLEPSRHYGHALLNRSERVIRSEMESRRNPDKPQRVAVIVYIASSEYLNLLLDRLNDLAGCMLSLYFTLPPEYAELLPVIQKVFPDAVVMVVPKRGQDVLPFVQIMRKIQEDVSIANILKICIDSTRASENALKSLIGSKARIDKHLSVLDKDTVILPDVAQADIVVSDFERTRIQELIGSMKVETRTHTQNQAKQGWRDCGTCWVPRSFLEPLMDLCLLPEDFEPDYGQDNNTMARIIRLCIGELARSTDKMYCTDIE